MKQNSQLALVNRQDYHSENTHVPAIILYQRSNHTINKISKMDMTTNLRENQSQNSQSGSRGGSKRSKSLDPAHVAGQTFQIEFLALLQDLEIIPQGVKQKKTSYCGIGKEAFEQFLKVKHQHQDQGSQENGFEQIDHILNLVFTKNAKEQFEVQYDVYPHVRQDLTYQQVMDKILSCAKQYRLNFYQNILQVPEPQGSSKNIIYCGQMKTNMFRQKQYKKGKEKERENSIEKDLLTRKTAEIIRKICMIQLDKFQNFMTSFTQHLSKNVGTLVFDAKVGTRLDELFKEHTKKNFVNLPVVFFIFAKQLTKDQFVNQLQGKNLNILKRFCRARNVVIHILCWNKAILAKQVVNLAEKIEKMDQKIDNMEKRMDDMQQKIDEIKKEFKESFEKLYKMIQSQKQETEND